MLVVLLSSQPSSWLLRSKTDMRGTCPRLGNLRQALQASATSKETFLHHVPREYVLIDACLSVKIFGGKFGTIRQVFCRVRASQQHHIRPFRDVLLAMITGCRR